ncbi:HTH cro/C1-type domain-containing protein, partial [Dysosmobacter welbionis]
MRIFQCFFQPAAIHQRHRIPVVPGGTACGVFLRILHPLRGTVVVDIVIQIVAGEGIPEGDLQILMGLFFGESS